MAKTLEEHNDQLQSRIRKGAVQSALKDHPGLKLVDADALAELTLELIDQEHEKLSTWVEYSRKAQKEHGFGTALLKALKMSLNPDRHAGRQLKRIKTFANKSCVLEALQRSLVDDEEALNVLSDMELRAFEAKNNPLHQALRDLRRTAVDRRKELDWEAAQARHEIQAQKRMFGHLFDDNLEALQRLVDEYGEVLALTERPDSLSSPLIKAAARNNHLEAFLTMVPDAKKQLSASTVRQVLKTEEAGEVSAIIDRNPEILDDKDQARTLLNVAINARQVSAVEYLVEQIDHESVFHHGLIRALFSDRRDRWTDRDDTITRLLYEAQSDPKTDHVLAYALRSDVRPEFLERLLDDGGRLGVEADDFDPFEPIQELGAENRTLLDRILYEHHNRPARQQGLLVEEALRGGGDDGVIKRACREYFNPDPEPVLLGVLDRGRELDVYASIVPDGASNPVFEAAAQAKLDTVEKQLSTLLENGIRPEDVGDFLLQKLREFDAGHSTFVEKAMPLFAGRNIYPSVESLKRLKQLNKKAYQATCEALPERVANSGRIIADSD